MILISATWATAGRAASAQTMRSKWRDILRPLTRRPEARRSGGDRPGGRNTGRRAPRGCRRASAMAGQCCGGRDDFAAGSAFVCVIVALAASPFDDALTRMRNCPSIRFGTNPRPAAMPRLSVCVVRLKPPGNVAPAPEAGSRNETDALALAICHAPVITLTRRTAETYSIKQNRAISRLFGALWWGRVSGRGPLLDLRCEAGVRQRSSRSLQGRTIARTDFPQEPPEPFRTSRTHVGSDPSEALYRRIWSWIRGPCALPAPR